MRTEKVGLEVPRLCLATLRSRTPMHYKAPAHSHKHSYTGRSDSIIRASELDVWARSIALDVAMAVTCSEIDG